MRLIAMATVTLVLGLVCSAPALGDGPAWQINSVSNTTVAPGGTLRYHVQITNAGSAASDGSEIDVTATLPTGLTAVEASGDSLSCSGPGGSPVAGATVVTCSGTPTVPAHDSFDFTAFLLTVAVDSNASGLMTSSFLVSGGGAGSASTVDPTVVTPVAPDFGVDALDGQVTATAAGDPLTQAGGHPYDASTSIDFDTTTNPNPLIGELWPVEPTKDILVDLPAGFVVNPNAATTCTASQLANAEGITARPLCPPASQVGSVLVRFNNSSGATTFGPLPVFELVPPPNRPAQFGFNVLGTVVTLGGGVRSESDYGLSANLRNVSEGLGLAGSSLTLWGVPADSGHDADRACAGQSAPSQGGPSCTSGAPLQAFLRNPTACTPDNVGLPTTAHIDSWTHPGVFKTATFMSHVPPGYPSPPSDWGHQQGPTGCDSVPFDPTLTGTPAAPVQPGQPDGFSFDLSLPQNDDPSGVGEADLKKAVVTLPEGVRVSPSSADRLGGCSPSQIGLHSADDPTCPDSSKIGSLTLTTPLLDQELKGSVYLATPHDNPFDSLIALYLVAKGPGVTIKLPGKVETDPQTGQVTTTFDDNPQLPFSNLHLELKTGSRAPLVLPKQCGTYTTHAELTSWSGKTVPADSSFTVTGDAAACAAAGFTPDFSAFTENPVARARTPFFLRLARDEQDQEIGSLGIDTPGGLLAKLANSVLCPEFPAHGGLCTNGSRVGNVTVGAGAGPDPFFIRNGQAFITDRYKGGRYGLSILVPAVAGPFDLGNVVVRASIHIDHQNAHLRVVSDPLPTILDGIPLDVRDVRVLIDKPDFIVNPTNCALKHVFATVGSTQGAIAHVSSRFQVTDCGELPLTPKLSLTVGARRHTQAGVSTPLTTTLTQPPGQSNLRTVSVALPGTLNALLPVVNRACKLAEYNAGTCGDRAKVGTAVAVTPLLRDPLKGSVYFVKNPARVLPDLMVALRGGVDIDVTGKISIPGGKRLATRFDTIPDAAITKFTLRIPSGKNSPLGIATNLCSAKGRAATAAVAFRGQNGKLVKVNQRLHIAGCATASKARRRR